MISKKMEANMRRIFVVVSIAFPFFANATSDLGKYEPELSQTCTIGQETLAIGESRWVTDPILKELESSKDFQGFRVVCRNAVSIGETNGKAGSVVIRTGATLVLTEFSEEVHEFVSSSEFAERRGLSKTVQE